ncbi:unnamed protein product, partial [Pylaiella littoralis]
LRPKVGEALWKTRMSPPVEPRPPPVEIRAQPERARVGSSKPKQSRPPPERTRAEPVMPKPSQRTGRGGVPQHCHRRYRAYC